MYKLLIEDDEGGQTAVSLIRDEITIGRKEGNTIRLTDRNVSRRHGRIVREDDEIYIEDVAARYGIEKNGERIRDRASFEEGDVVLIGDYRLTLQPETEDAEDSDDDPEDGEVQPPEKPEPEGATEDDFVAGRDEETQVMQAMPAKLVIISSNFAGQEFPLSDEEMVIGRSEDCDIIIDHRSVSSRHAKIVREDNVTYKIVDLDSKNGVYVSGDSYSATILKRGDVVELGHVKLRFVEPGENYVFDPEAAEEAQSVAVSEDGGPDFDPKKVGVAIGAVVAVALAGGLFALMPSDEESDSSRADEEVVEVQDLEDDEGGERVDKVIETARSDIREGELEGAINRLQTLKDVADPSPEQSGEIEDLLSTAKNEQPFKKRYVQALENLEDEQPLEALTEISSIPSESMFDDRLEEQGLGDEIFDAALDRGYQALENGDFERARTIGNDILMADPSFEPAGELLDAVEKREQQQREAVAEGDETDRGDRVASANDTTAGPGTETDPGDRRPDPAPDPEPSPEPEPEPEPEPTPEPDSGPELTAEEAKQKYNEAARQVVGDPQRAIEVCSQALEAGHTDCHRVLGLAYARLEETDSACRHFEQYMASGPSNPAMVESQMNEHGCSE